MEYLQAVEWVHSLKRFAPAIQQQKGKHVAAANAPELQRMRELLAALGNPQRRLRFIHVAGTNGKGSTVMMLAAILTKAGYKTGANISPYVLDFRERFLLNGEMIAPQELAEVLTQVRRATETLEQAPIEFEAVTAAALVYFAQNNCDVICLEAGVGGRLDSTNVVENTLVACITQVGFDHTEILGESLAQIAAEKCGIFKNECPVICYPVQPKQVATEIMLQAAKAKCPLVVPSEDDFVFEDTNPEAPFTNKVNYGGYELNVPFLGRHQALNASVAVEAALQLWRQGFIIEDKHICDGIASAKFPGRIEVLQKQPVVLLDGAHNVDSAKALARTLIVAKLKYMNAVVGVLEDKQAKEIVEAMAPYIRKWFAVTPSSPRALPAGQLAQIIESAGHRVEVHDDLGVALQEASEEVGDGVIVFGSLYLVAQARPLLLDARTSPKADSCLET